MGFDTVAVGEVVVPLAITPSPAVVVVTEVVWVVAIPITIEVHARPVVGRGVWLGWGTEGDGKERTTLPPSR